MPRIPTWRGYTWSSMRSLMRVPAILLGLTLSLACSGCAWGWLGLGGGWRSEIEEVIRSRTATGNLKLHSVQDDYVHAKRTLPRVYLSTGYEPVWISAKGPLPQMRILLKRLERSIEDGLDPDYYHRAQIRRLLAEIARARRDKENEDDVRRRERIELETDLDLLLTDAFLLLASHLHSGRVSGRRMDYEWYAERAPRVDLAEVLVSALQAGAPADGSPHPVLRALDRLAPSNPAYLKLKEALARYRAILRGGGLPQVRPRQRGGGRGESFPEVTRLRRALQMTGDYSGPLIQGRSRFVFDAELERALRRFQERHGLKATGILDEKTLEALNEPIERGIKRILVNLERWRWLPADLGERYVIVNIANFSLEMFERDRITVRMRVVVGKQYRRTPVFSSEITRIVLNPPWMAPNSIVVNDLLPIIRQDPSYLRRHGYEILEDGYYGGKIVDPDQVDWKSMDIGTDDEPDAADGKGKFPYFLRQKPGRLSALGRFKFDIPNPYSVYLHDTPSKGYFEVDRRDFSSGCIRLEKPLDLAVALLRDAADWPRSRIVEEVNRQDEIRTRAVKLPRPVPVHLLYWTSWVAQDGSVHFRPDIYDRDSALEELIQPRVL